MADGPLWNRGQEERRSREVRETGRGGAMSTEVIGVELWTPLAQAEMVHSWPELDPHH